MTYFLNSRNIQDMVAAIQNLLSFKWEVIMTTNSYTKN